MSFTARLRHVWYDRRGNFVLIFALLLLPLIGLLGLAVDYALLSRCKTQLDATNDAAVLAAATAASQTIQTESTSTSNSAAVQEDAETAAKNAYNSFFASDSSRARGVSITPATPIVAINGLNITVTGQYTAQSPNIFGGIFGVSASNVAGISQSSVALPRFVNIYIVYDDSQSEGIGTTANDMGYLQALTISYPDTNGNDGKPTGCQFGCHVPVNNPTTGPPYPKKSYEQIAHQSINPIIKLRIDSIRDAIVDIIDQAAGTPTGANGTPVINLAIYSMDKTLNPVTFVSGTTSTLSSNYQAMHDTIYVTPAQLQAGTTGPVDLESKNVDGSGPGDSYQVSTLTDPMSGLAAKIPADGDGSSAAHPVNYVFIMTDGVTDQYDTKAPKDNHLVTAMDPNTCSAFAGKAVVDVIYTEYLQMPNRSEWTDLVQSITNNIAPNMLQCTKMGDSPPTAPNTKGQYILATSGDDITSAAKTLLAQAIAQERLTQ